MKARRFLAVVALLSSAAFAEDAADPAGSWTLPGDPKCPFTFELRDGKVTRTTGTLVYTTKAKLVADGEGWQLEEELEKHNDGVSCRGAAANTVVGHLKKKAYIEVKNGRLLYSLRKDQPPAHSFVRASK